MSERMRWEPISDCEEKEMREFCEIYKSLSAPHREKVRHLVSAVAFLEENFEVKKEEVEV